MKRRSKKPKKVDPKSQVDSVGVRVIGGKLRGSKIDYSGLRVTRPMKDRLREALFNLVHTDMKNKYVIDFFAGTGAVGIEAISRGAAKALFLERHYPTADVLKRNIQNLQLESISEILIGDSFFNWEKQNDQWDRSIPWAVFFCPPYAFYEELRDEIFSTINTCLRNSPDGSLIAIETPIDCDINPLDLKDDWDFRSYGNATIGVFRKPSS